MFPKDREVRTPRFFSFTLKKSFALVILGLAGFLASWETAPVYAENSTITLTVPKTLSVTVGPGDGMQYSTGKISLSTNAAFGYTVNIKAKESGTDLKSTDGSTIPTVKTASATIAPTAWGWRAGDWTGASGDPNTKNFEASPNNTTGTTLATGTASTTDISKQYYLTIGANVAASQPKGTYTKNFVVTATAAEKKYNITYDNNDATIVGGTNTVSTVAASTYTKYATFSAKAAPTAPSSGHTFKGWCTKETTTDTCAGTICAAGSTCKLAIAEKDTEIKLYAMWHRDFQDLTSMQHYGRLTADAKAKATASMTTNQQYELKDERDSRMYYVAKLADNNVWMTENLDLDLSTSKALTPDNTDIPVDWTPTRSTLTATSDWANDNNTPYSYDPGNRCWNGTMTTTSKPITDNAVANDCNKHDASHWHVGDYYNWSAAVAMNNTASYTTQKQDLNQSICPKGWRLPSYEGDKSFKALKDDVDFTSGTSGNIQNPPYHFPYGGSFYSNSSNYVGSIGYFWSSAAYSSTHAHYLYFSSAGGLNPQNNNNRHNGFSVRCVARTGDDAPGINNIQDLTTMQQWGNLSATNKTNVLNSMTQDQQYELKDERDGRIYYIAKLADDNVWMTENLDLDLDTEKTFTADNTDIFADWTPTRSTLTTTSDWADDYNTPYSYEPGDRCWNESIIPSSNPVTDSSVAKDCNKHDASHWHVGNYYNWSAAVAMNSTSSYTTQKQDVNQSICPRGWRLPTYEGDRSFLNLKDKTSFTAGPSGNVHTSPYYFSYSGSFYNGASMNVGNGGSFWSSVVYSNYSSYALNFAYNADLYPQSYSGRVAGRSIRCVAR